MFTSDTGQITHHHPSLPPSLAPSLGLTLQQVPGKGTTGTTAPLPVLYGPGTANTTAMFLQGGSGQQIQLQAVQSQVSGFIHNVQVIDWNSLYSGEFDCIFLCNTTGQRYSHPLLEKVVSLDQNTKHQFQLFPAAGFCCKVKLLRREIPVTVVVQSPTRDGGKTGLETGGGSPAWRWTSLSSQSCPLPNNTAATPQLATPQGISYAGAQVRHLIFVMLLITSVPGRHLSFPPSLGNIPLHSICILHRAPPSYW